MYCKNCGKEIEDGKELCTECEPKEEVVATETPVEAHVEENATIEEVKVEEKVQKEEPKTTTANTTSTELKSKMAAGLLGIFLGQFGVHNFYLGYTNKAIIQVSVSAAGYLLSICTLGLSCFAPLGISIWGLIEGIMILTGSIDKDGKGNPLKE